MDHYFHFLKFSDYQLDLELLELSSCPAATVPTVQR